MNALKKFFTSPMSVPTYNDWEDATKHLKYSPDKAFLQNHTGWHLFCYSREQIGHPDHQLISDATHVGTAYTLRQFAGWRKKIRQASYAIALDEGMEMSAGDIRMLDFGWRPSFNAYKSQIKGEIHFVSPETLLFLDTHLENGVAFERRRVSLVLPYRFFYETSQGVKRVSERYTEIIIAYMYVGKNDYWNPLLDKGFLYSPMKLFQPNDEALPRHYSFDKMSYE